MNVEDFVLKTNIKAIILDEYRKDVRDTNAELSDQEFTDRVLEYNLKRMDARKWNRSGLKDLKFIDVQQQSSGKVTLTTTTTTMNSKGKTSNRSQLNTNDKSHSNRSERSMDSNDFQKEIMAMSYETFINETNVRELVRKNFENKTESLTEAAMEVELKNLNEQRFYFRRYHKCMLNHLKILKCGCRRNKTFEDKCTQTNMVELHDANAQCDSVEDDSNRIVDQSHNSSLSKLKMLTVHEITESEIIQIESITSTVVAGKK